jgi:TonB family protein
MGSSFRAAAALVAFFTALPLCAQAPQQTAEEQYKQLVDSTQLDAKSAQPFHLKIDAKVDNLSGIGSKQGTIEAWWVAPDDYRIEISSGSLHEVTATGESDPSIKPTRAGYLLDQLYDAIVHPLLQFPSAKDVTETEQNFGKTKLTCFQPLHIRDVVPVAGPPTFCTEPGTNKLRVGMHDFEVMLRNPVRGVAPTSSAISTTISYFGREAVSGTITTFEPFTPGAPGAPMLTPNLPRDSAVPTTTRISGSVLAGKLISKVSPDYPEDARMRHIGGIVLLHAIITKQGTIGSLVVIASPDESLSGAALNAVHEWRYQPYLLNGQPTAVDTTIQVHFNLNSF